MSSGRLRRGTPEFRLSTGEVSPKEGEDAKEFSVGGTTEGIRKRVQQVDFPSSFLPSTWAPDMQHLNWLLLVSSCSLYFGLRKFSQGLTWAAGLNFR